MCVCVIVDFCVPLCVACKYISVLIGGTPWIWFGNFHVLYSSLLWPRYSQALVSFVLCLVAQLCPTLCNPMDCSLPSSFVRGDSPGESTGVGSHALLQGIFPTQGSNLGLPPCRQILYCLSHQGSSFTEDLFKLQSTSRNLLALQLLNNVTWPRFKIVLKCRHLSVWNCLQISALKVIYTISLFSQLHVK